MRKYILLSFILSLQLFLIYAQTPYVPDEMTFADMTLKISSEAKHEIQSYVNALTKSPTYFNQKLDRANTYFPVIEQIFAEEQLPDDFKYLVLQESALIADAVSSSNAVGFWQFKKKAAIEMELNVSSFVDERMNIVSSSHAAAKYLKTNNFYFGNWIYALLAYNVGRGGAQSLINTDYTGVKEMVIDKHMHWYVKKFLAHKIAFQDAIHKNPNTKYTLLKYPGRKNEKLQNIANSLNIDYEILGKYNQWVKKDSLPGDKTYTVIVPVQISEKENVLALINIDSSFKQPDIYPDEKDIVKKDSLLVLTLEKQTPQKTEKQDLHEGSQFEVDVDFIEEQTISQKTEEIPDEKIIKKEQTTETPEKTDMVEASNNKYFHEVLPGETLYGISRQYKVSIKNIMEWNEKADFSLQPGDQLLIKKDLAN